MKNNEVTEITLGGRSVNKNAHPYIIAEIGVNHEGCLKTALKLIDQAKAGGADAAKFQAYKANKLTVKNSPAYWDTSKEPTTSQFKLFQKYDSFEEKEYIQLASHCLNIGIDFISTPFDEEAVEFLDPLMPFYKVASADITNTPLLRKIASKEKPVLLSTGAANINEVQFAVNTLNSAGCSELALLHCILNYPCANENANLNMIYGLKKSFPNLLIGYSDHTLPDPKMLVLTSAWLKGAIILEKHFTHNKLLKGNDHYHAMDENDLSNFIENINLIRDLSGQTEKSFLPSEKMARLNARRSIVVDKPLEIGQRITEDNISCKRPAHGISTKHWDEVLGKTVIKKLEFDHILTWDDID